ncbi:MAG: hypothetical protein ACFFCW_41595 [Candidatus Hodarchaeota archaeon]
MNPKRSAENGRTKAELNGSAFLFEDVLENPGYMAKGKDLNR